MNKKKIFSWLLLVGAFVALCLFMNAKVECLLDSDMSSEMVLSRLLASEKAIMTDKWYYSTELRVVNMQLFFTGVFLFLKNWHAVRIISGILMYLMMLAGYYYLCRQLKCKEYFALTGAFLLMPFSNGYFDYILLGLCYIFPITISFVTIGLVFQCMRSSGVKKKIVFALACILAVIAGTNGERQLVILYLPLVMSAGVWMITEWREHGHSVIRTKGIDQYLYI